MSYKQPPVHLHLLESFDVGWDGLQLIHEIEPADETPQTYLGQHFIVIALGDFRASYMLDGSCWHHVDYTQGNIAIFPAHEAFPRTQIDREVELVELLLDPITLARTACELMDADNIELVPHLHLHDPLIEHMGFIKITQICPALLKSTQ